MGEKNCPRGVKLTKKNVPGGKIGKKIVEKMSEGG